MQASDVEHNETDPPPQNQWITRLHHLLNYSGDFIIWFLKLICFPFKDFFASVQRASKRDNNNRTPGEGTCFELGNYFEFYTEISEKNTKTFQLILTVGSIFQITFRCQKIPDHVGRCDQYQGVAIFKMLSMQIALEIQRCNHQQPMLRLVLLYRPLRIPHFISNKINWTSNYFITQQ